MRTQPQRLARIRRKAALFGQVSGWNVPPVRRERLRELIRNDLVEARSRRGTRRMNQRETRFGLTRQGFFKLWRNRGFSKPWRAFAPTTQSQIRGIILENFLRPYSNNSGESKKEFLVDRINKELGIARTSIRDQKFILDQHQRDMIPYKTMYGPEEIEQIKLYVVRKRNYVDVLHEIGIWVDRNM